MNSGDAQELIHLYERSASLLNSLRGKYSGDRNRDAAIRYNTLRKDVKRFTNDPQFDRLIPRAWYFTPIRDILLAVLVFAVGIGLTSLVPDEDIQSSLQVALMVIGMISILAIAVLLGYPTGKPFLSSTVEQVRDRANMLHDYIQEMVRRNPALSFTGDQDWRIKALEEEMEALSEEVDEKEEELKHSRELWRGLESPSRLEVPEEVLVKLDLLERTRLLEAVQAYRVNAWTPTAAVCGMILEGWLQRLCRENGLPLGGMRAMIERLGEAGLLHGYHDKLAQIGEFFRHRATHPTSEEFDREKTTLILTSLIILIRDLF
jgi:hypothetical protein